ncbi:MAG: response regulator [Spirochaetaceae bacterium]|nr:response regulator [Spirochaetaceae bacterium]MBP5328857.1 response regulator [Spirochaetaceae bacterium]
MNNPARILTVDDDPVLRVHVTSSLKKFYEVKSVSSAKEAISYLSENSVDLLILDVCMPEMDGIELYKWTQENPSTKNVPAIFLTGVEDDNVLQALVKTNANDYLNKPISPSELLVHVKNQLEAHSK